MDVINLFPVHPSSVAGGKAEGYENVDLPQMSLVLYNFQCDPLNWIVTAYGNVSVDYSTMC